jgi:hypothetical protein
LGGTEWRDAEAGIGGRGQWPQIGLLDGLYYWLSGRQHVLWFIGLAALEHGRPRFAEMASPNRDRSGLTQRVLAKQQLVVDYPH